MNATSNCANFRCNNIANLVAASIVLLTEVRNLRVAPLVSVYVLSHYFRSYLRFFKIIFTIDYRFWTSASAANMRRVPGSLRSGTTTSWLLPVYLFIRKTPFAKGSLKRTLWIVILRVHYFWNYIIIVTIQYYLWNILNI